MIRVDVIVSSGNSLTLSEFSLGLLRSEGLTLMLPID
jgi:hypothetical protein